MATNFLIIGESCQDVFQYGRSERLSPEAPVPVFVPVSKSETGGMAKNVYNNLIALIRHEKCNDSVYHIFSRNQAVKTRFVDEKTNHLFLRVDEYDNIYEQIDFDPEIEYKIKSADCIIISDYGKGFLTDDDIFWISEIKKKDTIIFLDTKKQISEKLMLSCNYLKINEKEYRQNFDKTLLEDYVNQLIVTLGQAGAKYEDKLYHVENPQNTIDVSGAGDTFLAALSFKFMKNKDIGEAIQYANLISSKVVLKRGVSTI